MAKSMIACYLSKSVAEELEVPGLEKSSDLHLTLVYLGDISTSIDLDGLTDTLENWAEARSPLVGSLGQVSRFPANESTDGMDVAYFPFQSEQLADFRDSLLQAIAPFGLESVSEFEYTPHITIGYIPPETPLPETEYQSVELSFDCIYLCIGGLDAKFPLMGAVDMDEEEDDSEDEEEYDSPRFFVSKLSTKYQQIAPTDKPRSMYWGLPVPEDLERINAITRQQWESNDWEIVPFKMSDNLVWRSKGKWHQRVLEQMPKEMVSRPIIFDHNWDDSMPSIGIIIDSFMQVEVSPNRQFYRDTEVNRTIIQKEKYKAVYALGAFHADMRQVVNGLKTRRYNDVSTGSWMYESSLICPHCSEQYGYDIDFRMVDDEGNWICPHLPPDFEGMDTDLPVMDYIIYDGIYDGIELSLCLAGNLPLAGAVR